MAERRAEEPAAAAHGSQWVDPGASSALCLLAGSRGQAGSLPACLYSEGIAPFLRFHGPQPNQLYVVGGRNQQQDPLDTVEMFDTWRGQWVACPNMLTRRSGCAAAALPDGRLLVVGGYDQRGIAEGLLGSCEAFDPLQAAWRPETHGLNRARWGHGCATLGGLVYAVGGCSLPADAPPDEALMETLRGCEAYDPSTGTWAPCAELNVARAGARVVALGGLHLAAVGGCDDVFGRAELLPSVELLDAQSGRWSLLAPRLSLPRTTAAVAAVDDGRILVVGGTPELASGELYRLPETEAAQRARPAPTPAARGPKGLPACGLADSRMGCQAVALDLPAPGKAFPLCGRRCVVVVGGESGDEEFDTGVRQFTSVAVYDVKDGDWRPEKSLPPIPTPRTAMALAVAPGVIPGHA